MIKKLANIANEFDKYPSLMSFADELTWVMNRVAQRYAGELFEDEDDSPDNDYTFPGEEKRWNKRDSIDVFDNDFHREFKDKNPQGWDRISPELEKARRGGVTGTKWMHGTPINFDRPGYISAFNPEMLAEMLYPHDALEQNREEISRRFDGITRNRKNRSTLNFEYASGSGPDPDEDLDVFKKRSRDKRRMKFDPYLYEKYLAEDGRALEGKLPMFHGEDYDSLFDPTYEGYNSEKRQYKLPKDVHNPFGEDLLTPKELRSVVEEGVKGPGWLSGYALRHLNPGQTFGLETYKRPIDEISKKKRPNFYTRRD